MYVCAVHIVIMLCRYGNGYASIVYSSKMHFNSILHLIYDLIYDSGGFSLVSISRSPVNLHLCICIILLLELGVGEREKQMLDTPQFMGSIFGNKKKTYYGKKKIQILSFWLKFFLKYYTDWIIHVKMTIFFIHVFYDIIFKLSKFQSSSAK